MSRCLAIFLAIAFVACGPRAHAQTLEVQERCATAAGKAFQQLEGENDAKYDASTLIRKGVARFQSHYNTRLDRCLLLISRVEVLPLTANLSNQQRQSALVDANERRYYATYIETQLASEPRAKIERCELRPTMRHKLVCTTRGEFDAFVATYLEQ